MALTKKQEDKILSLISEGKLSNVKIASTVKCGATTVRNYRKKFNGEIKHDLEDIAVREVRLLELGKVIDEDKKNFSDFEKEQYVETFNRVASEQLSIYQELYNTANELVLRGSIRDMIRGTKQTKINVGDGVQNIEDIELEPVDRVNHAKALRIIGESLGITAKQDIINNTQINVGDVKRVVIKKRD